MLRTRCGNIGESWDVVSREFVEAEGVANLVRRVILELPTPGKKDGVWGLRKSTKLVLRELSSCRFSGQGTPLGIFSHHWQQRLASTRREGTSWDGGPRLAKARLHMS